MNKDKQTFTTPAPMFGFDYDEITITLSEYEDLLDDRLRLLALEGAGVDNWSGYEDAMEILEEMRKQINEN